MEDLAEGSIRTAAAALEIAQNQYETTKDALERANNELRRAQEEALNNPESYVA
jgi:hypothetical protein